LQRLSDVRDSATSFSITSVDRRNVGSGGSAVDAFSNIQTGLVIWTSPACTVDLDYVICRTIEPKEALLTRTICCCRLSHTERGKFKFERSTFGGNTRNFRFGLINGVARSNNKVLSLECGVRHVVVDEMLEIVVMPCDDEIYVVVGNVGSNCLNDFIITSMRTYGIERVMCN